MPHIAPSLRAPLDPLIEALAFEVTRLAATGPYDDTNAQSLQLEGVLNYTFTRLGVLTLPARRYWAMSLIRHAMVNAADEWYRRVMVPYEDDQADKNGDVYSELFRD